MKVIVPNAIRVTATLGSPTELVGSGSSTSNDGLVALDDVITSTDGVVDIPTDGEINWVDVVT